MSKHITHKNTPEGRAETIRRKAERRRKYGRI